MAWVNSASRLKPKRLRISTDISAAPESSRTALMIWTQVVASMPPKVT